MESLRSASVLTSKIYIAVNILTQVLGFYALKYFYNWLDKYRVVPGGHHPLSFQSQINAHSMFMAIVLVLFGNGLLLFRLLRSIPRDGYYFVHALYHMFGVFPLLAGMRMVYTWTTKLERGNTFHAQVGLLAFMLFILAFLLDANGFFAPESSEREDSRILQSYISMLALSLGMVLGISQFFLLMLYEHKDEAYHVKLEFVADYGKSMLWWVSYGSMVLILTGFRDIDGDQSSSEDSYVVSNIFYPS